MYVFLLTRSMIHTLDSVILGSCKLVLKSTCHIDIRAVNFVLFSYPGLSTGIFLGHILQTASWSDTKYVMTRRRHIHLPEKPDNGQTSSLLIQIYTKKKEKKKEKNICYVW